MKFKKYILVMFVFVALLTLASCSSSKAKITVTDVTPMRTSIGISIKISDKKDKITNGTVKASIYDPEDEDVTVDSFTFDDIDEDIQTHDFNGLKKNYKYQIKITATVDSKSVTYYNKTHQTITIGENAENAIIVKTASDFEKVKNDSTAYYKLENDIDFNEAELTPLFDDYKPFYGYFDGNGKTLKNFKITATKQYVGLFGYVSRDFNDKETTTPNIFDLNVDNAKVDVTKTSEVNIGIITGYNEGIIENVNITNSIVKLTSTNSTVSFVGTLVGTNANQIINCNVTKIEMIIVSKKHIMLGGLIGSNGSKKVINGAKVVNSHVKDTKMNLTFTNTDTATDKLDNSQYVGGFVGHSKIDITTATADTNIKATSAKYEDAKQIDYKFVLGGFAGRISNSVASDIAVKSTFDYYSKDIFNVYIGYLVGILSLEGEIKNARSFMVGTQSFRFDENYNDQEKFELIIDVVAVYNADVMEALPTLINVTAPNVLEFYVDETDEKKNSTVTADNIANHAKKFDTDFGPFDINGFSDIVKDFINSIK
ncbi:MAG: hypothetical protein ACRC5M_00505 [Anaeroplasmataceae bacterium]